MTLSPARALVTAALLAGCATAPPPPPSSARAERPLAEADESAAPRSEPAAAMASPTPATRPASERRTRGLRDDACRDATLPAARMAFVPGLIEADRELGAFTARPVVFAGDPQPRVTLMDETPRWLERLGRVLETRTEDLTRMVAHALLH